MNETLKKAAAELRKIAKEHNKNKLQKCAKIMLGATAMAILHRKIKGA